tara:strand:+ start:683 stop:856 length:174 start_codon:yes stop_codon:yes gene_type:complete
MAKKKKEDEVEPWKEYLDSGEYCPACGRSPFRYIDEGDGVIYYQDREGCEWEAGKQD